VENTEDQDINGTKHHYTKEEKAKLIKDNKLRAEELVKQLNLNDDSSKKLRTMVKEEVAQRKMNSYGSNNLPAGPDIYDANSIILVEGRADVINLMRYGIDNTIAIQGTNVPGNVIHLCNSRKVTALLDGDRGGDSILKELLLKTTIEFVGRAPEGREIEHLNREEILELMETGIKPVLEAEFINERISLIDFLKRNGRYNAYRK